MQVTLAWPADYTEYLVDAGITGDADETIDVPDHVAQRLLADGRARLPEPSKLSADEVVLAAQIEGVDLGDAKNVTEKRERLADARKQKEG